MRREQVLQRWGSVRHISESAARWYNTQPSRSRAHHLATASSSSSITTRKRPSPVLRRDGGLQKQWQKLALIEWPQVLFRSRFLDAAKAEEMTTPFLPAAFSRYPPFPAMPLNGAAFSPAVLAIAGRENKAVGLCSTRVILTQYGYGRVEFGWRSAPAPPPPPPPPQPAGSRTAGRGGGQNTRYMQQTGQRIEIEHSCNE